MVTVIEYAHLAGYIYHADYKTYLGYAIGKGSKKGPSPSILADWYCMEDVDPNLHFTNHFFAQLFIKFDKNKIATDAVVAVRGTVFKDPANDIVDVIS